MALPVELRSNAAGFTVPRSPLSLVESGLSQPDAAVLPPADPKRDAMLARGLLSPEQYRDIVSKQLADARLQRPMEARTGFVGPMPPVDNMKANETPANRKDHENTLATRRRDRMASMVEAGSMTVHDMARRLAESVLDSELTLLVRAHVRAQGSVSVVNTSDRPLPRGLRGVREVPNQAETSAEEADIVRFNAEDGANPNQVLGTVLSRARYAIGEVPTTWTHTLPSKIDDASLSLVSTENDSSVVALRRPQRTLTISQ